MFIRVNAYLVQLHNRSVDLCAGSDHATIRALCTGCPKKHGNSVTNTISSLLWISIVIPNFKSHYIMMSARVYFMRRVNDCKDVSKCLRKMNSEDGQVYSVCKLQFSCFTKYTLMQSKHKHTKCEHCRRNSYGLQLSQ